MKDCCQREAEQHLRKHRDVANCDHCGMLLIAYGNERDFQNTCDELRRHRVDFETWTLGKLKVIAKTR